MKRILITGKNSYIGNSLEKWMRQFEEEYSINQISLKDKYWKEQDFSKYDVIFHVAGIAHADVSKVDEETQKLYYKVNCDLAVKTAKKYKKDLKDKSGQFIYMSSIIVYGIESTIGKKSVITSETKPMPSNFYGDSKLKAEEGLIPLNDNNFKIAILRPPMIYGEKSKGNYYQLEKIANAFPVFPDIKNKRSMLHIDNLCQFVKKCVDNGSTGIYLPQDDEYVQTSRMVKAIAKKNGKSIILIPGFNWLVNLLHFIPGKVGKLTNKAFGSLIIDRSLTKIHF